MTFEAAKETFVRELPNMLNHQGEYALVSDGQVVGIWKTFDEALEEGYQAFGLDPFLVKQIERAERIHYLSVEFPTCES